MFMIKPSESIRFSLSEKLDFFSEIKEIYIYMKVLKIVYNIVNLNN